MSCSERLVKLVEFWQGLENARPARPSGASVIEQLAKKSIGIPFLLLATFAPSDSSTMARNIKAQMSFEATKEVIKVQKMDNRDWEKNKSTIPHTNWRLIGETAH